jgi:diguanylate cyclase (GGDEF)-like protein/PAS domain S-box-containing protein
MYNKDNNSEFTLVNISEARMQFEQLLPGDHLACFYENAEECQTLTQEFAKIGLSRGERVVILTSEPKRDDSLPMVYQLAEDLMGNCRPAVIEWLADQVDLARQQGQSGLRVMLEAKALPMPPTEVVELETALSRMAYEEKILLICLFDRRFFAADVLFDLATSHKKILNAAHLVEAVCFSEDLSHHLMIERALRKSEERYRNLVENQGEGVTILNAELVIEFANLAAGYIMGSTADNLVGLCLNDLLAPGQSAVIENQVQLRQKGQVSTYELAVLTLDDRLRQLLVTATPRFDSSGKFNGSFAVFRDITERKDREDRLHFQATHDLLTGLHNRAYFDEQIARMEANRHGPVSIIVIDLDNLKKVNDHYGHLAGDEILRQMAGLLQKSFRSQDIVARLGGDEFAVVLPGTDALALRQAFSRLEDNLKELRAKEHAMIDFSSGGATAGLSDLLMLAFKAADEQMYIQKRAKKII